LDQLNLVPPSCGGALHAPQLAARVRRRRLTGEFLRLYEEVQQAYEQTMELFVIELKSLEVSSFDIRDENRLGSNTVRSPHLSNLLYTLQI
jgi:hypothetical protein